MKALFDADQKWRLVEEFGTSCFTENDDGRLLFTADYTDMENLVTWLMTFGDKVEVLEPKEARENIMRMVQKMTTIYKEDAEIGSWNKPGIVTVPSMNYIAVRGTE